MCAQYSSIPFCSVQPVQRKTSSRTVYICFWRMTHSSALKKKNVIGNKQDRAINTVSKHFQLGWSTLNFQRKRAIRHNGRNSTQREGLAFASFYFRLCAAGAHWVKQQKSRSIDERTDNCINTPPPPPPPNTPPKTPPPPTHPQNTTPHTHPCPPTQWINHPSITCGRWRQCCSAPDFSQRRHSPGLQGCSIINF